METVEEIVTFSSQIYNNRAALGLIGAVPSYLYFDWSEPMVPFSILMSYIHIVIWLVLLRIIDVLANDGKVSDVFQRKT